MLGTLLNNPLAFICWVVALAAAITIHEFAHAWAAERLGDPTPRLLGRLTLNPLAHLDLVGTIMLIFARFGWGKPVPFDPFNLRNPRRDSALISLAGPTANLALAVLSSLALRLWIAPMAGVSLLASIFLAFFELLITMNVMLAVFNLIPIHPLDGFKIVGGLLPEESARQWQELEGYGMIFLIFLIFPFFGSSAISQLISPVINFLVNLLLPSAPLI